MNNCAMLEKSSPRVLGSGMSLGLSLDKVLLQYPAAPLSQPVGSLPGS